jgi:hypothetical protein
MFIDNNLKDDLIWHRQWSKANIYDLGRDIETLSNKLMALEKHLNIEYYAQVKREEGYREAKKK